MNWKKYQNELIVLVSFMLMFFAYVYKYGQNSSQTEAMIESKYAMEEIKEVIALKKIWSNAKTTQKLNKLETLIPESKVTWSNKSKKVTAIYKALTDSELNTLVSKILMLPVEIKKLKIQKLDSSYDVEFKCQW